MFYISIHIADIVYNRYLVGLNRLIEYNFSLSLSFLLFENVFYFLRRSFYFLRNESRKNRLHCQHEKIRKSIVFFEYAAINLYYIF